MGRFQLLSLLMRLVSVSSPTTLEESNTSVQDGSEMVGVWLFEGPSGQ
jgi:hypothetical protein